MEFEMDYDPFQLSSGSLSSPFCQVQFCLGGRRVFPLYIYRGEPEEARRVIREAREKRRYVKIRMGLQRERFDPTRLCLSSAPLEEEGEGDCCVS